MKLEGKKETQNDLSHMWAIKKTCKELITKPKNNRNKEQENCSSIRSLPLNWRLWGIIKEGKRGQWWRGKVTCTRGRLESGRETEEIGTEK